MENTPATITQAVIKKQEAFSAYALESHNKLQELQSRAAIVIATLSEVPTAIEQINDSEANLKRLKAEINSIKADRLAQTSKLDKFFENFMLPEKSSLAAVPAYEQAIIKLKNEKAKLDAIQANKDAELKKVRETYLTHINNSIAGFESLIADSINTIYSFALTNAINEATIKTKKEEISIDDYYVKAIKSKSPKDFIISYPEVQLIYNTTEQLNAIWIEVSSGNLYLDGVVMFNKFEQDLKDKFKYFSTAIKDKERAIAHSEKLAREAKEQAETNAAQQNIGAKLEVNATVLGSVETTKALKEVFVLDMPQSKESALIIVAAFVSNLQKAADEVRVTNWMNLSINQMANALVGLKNKDAKFECTGIKFKTEQKL